MLDSVKPLFFNGRDQAAINDQRRGRVAVEGVNSDYVQRFGPFIIDRFIDDFYSALTLSRQLFAAAPSPPAIRRNA
jgi:hypothetical protein